MQYVNSLTNKINYQNQVTKDVPLQHNSINCLNFAYRLAIDAKEIFCALNTQFSHLVHQSQLEIIMALTQ